MKIKFPLKVSITKNTFTKKWETVIQYAPKESLQAKFSVMNIYSISFSAKTKKEVQEWIRQYKKEKRYIKDRERWLSTEKYFSNKETQQKATDRLNKMSRAFSSLGF